MDKIEIKKEIRTPVQTIDEYILQHPLVLQERMNILRKAIKEAAPEAAEKISWRMPTFYFNGNLVHFASHKNHIGFYPGPSGVANFKDRLTGYQNSKGAIQFPNDQPLPLELIKEIVAFRVLENTKQLGR